MGDALKFTVSFKDTISEKLGRFLPRAIEKLVEMVAYEVRQQILANVTGNVLKVRSGQLRNSWSGNPEMFRRGTASYAMLRSQGTPYAAIHEFGGTIRPKKAKHLWIPLNAMKTATGASRATPRELLSNPQSLGYDGTFTRKGIVFGKQKKEIIPLFVLVDSVEIPARKYISRAMREVNEKIDAIGNKAIVMVAREEGLRPR